MSRKRVAQAIDRQAIMDFNARAADIEPETEIRSMRLAVELAYPGLEKMEKNGFTQEQIWRYFQEHFGVQIGQRTFANYLGEARRKNNSSENSVER